MSEYYKMSKIKNTHDPKEHIAGLQGLLTSDKKRIAFLFGSGTSYCKKGDLPNIPDMQKMTKQVESILLKDIKFKKAVNEIKGELNNNYNIETFLSSIEQKKEVIAKGNLNGLSKQDFDVLIKKTKKQIKEIVSIHDKVEKENKVGQLIHSDFAQWVGRANRKYPIEIFTTNYDYLFEMGLEYNGIPYYDGFTGSYKPFFNSDTVNDLDFLSTQTKLWKLHGSLGWRFEQATKKIIRARESKEDNMLIYPSVLKYNDSKKMPYTAFTDRLKNFLREPDTLLITCGYSFRDDHINELIFSSFKSEKPGNVIALYYDIKKEGNRKDYTCVIDSNIVNLAKQHSRLSIYACRSAVIGCQYGTWKLEREPNKEDILNINLYFDEDAPQEDKGKGNAKLKWTGEGELVLPSFSYFVKFLQSMTVSTYSKTPQVKDE